MTAPGRCRHGTKVDRGDAKDAAGGLDSSLEAVEATVPTQGGAHPERRLRFGGFGGLASTGDRPFMKW